MFINENDLQSVKKSYLHILHMFLRQDQVKSKYISCLLKWGMYLRLDKSDIRELDGPYDTIPFDHQARAESIYHLVHMIYLDNIVEDVELEVATLYAQALGLDKNIVADLFKAIVTAPNDGLEPEDVRNEISDYLKLYNME